MSAETALVLVVLVVSVLVELAARRVRRQTEPGEAMTRSLIRFVLLRAGRNLLLFLLLLAWAASEDGLLRLFLVTDAALLFVAAALQVMTVREFRTANASASG